MQKVESARQVQVQNEAVFIYFVLLTFENVNQLFS